MKLVREYIYEKFIEDSDPIKDLGIGMIKFWKNKRKEAGARTSSASSEIYYGTKEYHNEAFMVYDVLDEIIIEYEHLDNKNELDVQKVFDITMYNAIVVHDYKIDVEKVIWALKTFFYIDVEYHKPKE